MLRRKSVRELEKRVLERDDDGAKQNLRAKAGTRVCLPWHSWEAFSFIVSSSAFSGDHLVLLEDQGDLQWRQGFKTEDLVYT